MASVTGLDPDWREVSDPSRQFGRARQLTQNRRFAIMPSVRGEAIRAIGYHPTCWAFSVVPPWGVPVVPSRGMSVIPTGGVSVYPQGGCRYYPLGVCRYYPLGVWGYYRQAQGGRVLLAADTRTPHRCQCRLRQLTQNRRFAIIPTVRGGDIL